MDRCSVSTICDDIVRLHQLIAYNLHDCNTSALDAVYLSLAITSCIAKVESMITSSVSSGVSVYDLISSLKPNNYVSDITSIVPLSVPLGDCITSSETTSRKRSFDAVEANSSNSSSTHFSEKLQEKDFVVPEVSTPVVDEEIKSEQYVLNSATVPSISSFDMDLNDNSRKVKKKPIIRFNGAQHDSLLPLSLIPCDDVMAEITQLDTVIHDRDKDLRYMALATMFDLDFIVMASLYGYCSEHCEKVYNRLISAHNWTNDQLLYLRKRLEHWHKRRDNRENIDWSEEAQHCGKSKKAVQEFCRTYGSIMRHLGLRGEKHPYLLRYFETGDY